MQTAKVYDSADELAFSQLTPEVFAIIQGCKDFIEQARAEIADLRAKADNPDEVPYIRVDVEVTAMPSMPSYVQPDAEGLAYAMAPQPVASVVAATSRDAANKNPAPDWWTEQHAPQAIVDEDTGETVWPTFEPLAL